MNDENWDNYAPLRSEYDKNYVSLRFDHIPTQVEIDAEANGRKVDCIIYPIGETFPSVSLSKDHFGFEGFIFPVLIILLFAGFGLIIYWSLQITGVADNYHNIISTVNAALTPTIFK